MLFTFVVSMFSSFEYTWYIVGLAIDWIALYIYRFLLSSGFGVPLHKGLLASLPGVLYHLQQFRSLGDTVGFRELFNYWHSSLRMIIEWCFGVLKNRFNVLKGMPKYKVCRQPLVVNACCTIHNFIRLVDRDDAFSCIVLLKRW